MKEAIVHINNETKQTGDDGIVVFEKLKKGYSDILVEKNNYNKFSGTINIKGTENIKHIQLEPVTSLIAPEPVIVFSKPGDGTIQATPVDLAGKGKHIPKDKHCWIVVNPQGSNGFWPQTREIFLKHDTTWTGNALLGGNSGQLFDIHFVLADQQAHQSFNDYITNCAKKEDYPEVPLPTGARSYGFITVKKK